MNNKNQDIHLITDQQVKSKIEEYMLDQNVLGIMLWGSRATGFGAPDSDWDALVLVTDEYYNGLDVKDTAFVVIDESIEPRKVLIDFSIWSEECAQQICESPMDIDHWAWIEGIIIHDPKGKMTEWKKKISRYPEEEHEERLKSKFVQLVVARYYAMVTEKRGYEPDSKLNLYRAMLSAVHLWFSLQKVWTPSLKWWSKHAKHIGMNEEIFTLFSDTLKNPSLDNISQIENYLKDEIIAQGYTFPNDFLQMLLETVHRKGRPHVIKHSYL
jgi:hypothetical protein